MAFTFPLARTVLSDILRIESVVWDSHRSDELSGSGDARTWQASLADPLWTAEVTLSERYHPDIKAIAAIIRKLQGSKNSFALADPLSLYPKSDPLGAILSVVNLLGYTQEFDNAAWTKFAVTVSANAALAPDGTMTADKLVDTAANSNHFIAQGVTVAAGQVQTGSVYAKIGEIRYLQVGVRNNAGTNGGWATFDLQTGTVTASGQLGTGTGLVTSIEAVANGFYRCRVSTTIGAADTVCQMFALLSKVPTGFAPTYLGNGSGGFFSWGAQVEAGATLGPYSGRSATAGASAPIITAIASDRQSITLGGLPSGYVLSAGDKAHASYSSSPTRRYFFEISETVTADQSGSATFEVYPTVPLLLATSAAVTLLQPACRGFILPGTFKPGTATKMTTSGAGFTFMERR